MVGRPAGDDDDAAGGREHRLCIAQGEAAALACMASERRAERSRLVVDLLAHKGRVTALLDIVGGPADALHTNRHWNCGCRLGQADAARRDHRELPVADDDGAVGEGAERGGGRCDEHLAVAEPDDERALLACRNQRPRVLAVEDDDRVVALELERRPADGLVQVVGVGQVPLDQVGDRLGVGVGGERAALSLEACPQRAVVLDDAVQDDVDAPVAVGVWVGVLLGHPTVGGPAGVGDAGGCVVGRGRDHVAARPSVLDRLAQDRQIPDRPVGVDPVTGVHRKPG